MFVDTGQLWIWGDNKYGQQAKAPSVPSQPTPELLPADLFDGQKVTEVHSGWSHIIAKTGQFLL